MPVPADAAQGRAALVALLREEGPGALATLGRQLSSLPLAEDAVQDAAVRALEVWPREGVPASPRGWLLLTARACLPTCGCDLRDCWGMSRDQVLTDPQWALIEPLLPSSKGKASRPFRDHRQVLEGIVFRYRTGCPWRDVPERFGPWQTLWKRHARFSKDGTWDRVLERLIADADRAGQVDWQLSLDSTISRVHQHAANLPREVALQLPSHTGGAIELQETTGRTC